VTTAAVILAAGGSSRFGGDVNKLVAHFRGRPLVSWAIDHAAEAGLDDLIVVMGAVDVAALASSPARVVPNDAWSQGQATSLQVAIGWAADNGHDAIVVGLGDQPLVEPSAWRVVAASTASIAVATYGGRRGHPVRLAREVWPLLPASGDEGARVLMRERPELVVEVACEGETVDIDTLEDLSEWS